MSIMYGVLFAYSLELFPIKARGTGYAIVYTAYRISTAMVCVWPISEFSGDSILYAVIYHCVICQHQHINTYAGLWSDIHFHGIYRIVFTH